MARLTTREKDALKHRQEIIDDIEELDDLIADMEQNEPYWDDDSLSFLATLKRDREELEMELSSLKW